MNLALVEPASEIPAGAPRASACGVSLLPAQRSARRPMLDVARLIGAYAIVWLHVPQTAALAAETAWGRFAVPFFTATAVLLVWEGLVRQPQRRLSDYAWTRLTRIYVPFLAWSVIYLAFKAVKARLLPNQPNDFPGIELLWVGSFYHLWFMPFILLVTLAAFVFARPLVSRPQLQGLAVGLALLAGWQLAWWPRGPVADGPSFGRLALDALPAACWGLALGIAGTRGWCWRTRGRSFSLVALVLAVAMTATVRAFGRSAPLENLAGLALLVFALGDWQGTRLVKLARLGPLAYGIYLAHLLPIKILQALGAKVGIAETTLTALAVFLIAAVGSTLVAWALNRTRWTRWLVG